VSSAVAPQVREAFLGKGNALEISGRHAQAQQVYRAMEAYARGHGDAAMEAEALIRLSASAVVTSDRSADVGTMLERAETLARQAGDRLILAQTLWNQGLRDRFRQPLRADEYFLKALEITRSPGCAELPPESGVRETEAHILVDLMVSGLTSGRRRMALYHGEEALAAFRELGNQAMVADALAGLANLNQAGAGFDTAIRYAEEGQAISEAIDNPWGFTYNGWARAQIEADRGDWSRALERATSLLAFAARVPFVGFRLALNAVLTRLWLDLGQPGRAAEHAQATARLWEENASPTEGWYSWVRAVEALSHLAMGDIPRAAQMLDEFRELPQGVIPGFQNYYYVGPVVAWLDFVRGDVERGLRFASEVIDRFDAEATDRFSAEMRTWRARLLLADGAPAEAEAELHRAIDILAPAGARAVLWPAHAARAEALTQMGDADGAQRERETAWNLIQSIADGLNPSHRVTFLARPEVARLQR
jgi:tetratricopeptide (TPR) repeat protein